MSKPCALVMEWVRRINSGESPNDVIPLTLPAGLTDEQYIECYAFAGRVLDGERGMVCRHKADMYLLMMAKDNGLVEEG